MDGDKSRIDEIRKRLYSRDKSRLDGAGRRTLRSSKYNVSGSWKKPAKKPVFSSGSRKRGSFLKGFLIFSIAFFVIAIGFSSIYFFGGSNIVSSDNIDIEIKGPTSIAGGEVLELQLTIINRNNVEIQLADLIIEYPDGTRTADDIGKELPRFREGIGSIRSGEKVKKTVKAVLFGEENSSKDIALTIEYRVKGSNAIFFTEKTYPIILSSSPLGIAVRSVEETVSGQDVTITVTAISNATTVIKDALMVAEYPFGFVFDSATPKPTSGNSVWDLGDLAPEEDVVIKINGRIDGQDGEERVFRFSGGVKSPTDESKLATTFSTVLTDILIKRPFLAVEVALNSDTSEEYIAEAGERIRADITWTNNLSTKITNAEIEVRLGGSFDKSSVSVVNGFFRSLDSTIVWNQTTSRELESINAGESGRLAFTFSPLDVSDLGAIKQPVVTVDVSAAGTRISENDVPARIESTAEKLVRVSSGLLLNSRILRLSSSLSNSGPFPPKADKETTYTSVWTVTNSSNQISNGSVSANLPPYVRFVGIVSPSSEKVTYNPVGGIVTWELGDIAAGVGNTTSPREVAFQLALTPSLSQVGTAPVLMGAQTIRGFDQFTETTIQSTNKALTTNLETESGFNRDNAVVGE
ncbi:MAG: hypothetical protein ISR99_02800 [Parcubacteria group bacterium]|nr:hypothetical protein [Parcubacteria group bacterium]